MDQICKVKVGSRVRTKVLLVRIPILALLNPAIQIDYLLILFQIVKRILSKLRLTLLIFYQREGLWRLTVGKICLGVPMVKLILRILCLIIGQISLVWWRR